MIVLCILLVIAAYALGVFLFITALGFTREAENEDAIFFAFLWPVTLPVFLVVLIFTHLIKAAKNTGNAARRWYDKERD